MGICHTKQCISEQVVPRVSMDFTPEDAIIFVLSRNNGFTISQILRVIETLNMWKEANTLEAAKVINKLVKNGQVDSVWDKNIRQCRYQINIKNMI